MNGNQMILSPQAVLRGDSKGSFVLDLGTRDLTNPEGAGLDLRVGAVHELQGDSFLGIEERYTPEAIPLSRDADECYELMPGCYYVATTIEKVRPPSDLAALVIARSSLYRSGLIMSAGLVAPGYEGAITVGLFNAGSKVFRLQQEARFIHIIFMAMSEAASLYRGQWQGGRIAAPDPETQV
ncbi:hypothetical protein [Mycobacterium sp. OAE908]|uniref:dCTP deaminase n=1 Tax=Mycobacterium sp. OAE908 TaxID=2817899 RepID=UPI001AE6EC47